MKSDFVSFQLITNENFNEIIKLSDTLTDQQKKCVAPNVYSLAQAYLNLKEAWPRAIYMGDVPIGFIMLDIDPEDIDPNEKAYYLWRFMIAKDFQGKGYGKKVLDLVINKCRIDHMKVLYTSCDMEDVMPYRFYINYGFKDTGILEDGEEVLVLDLATKL